MPEVFRTGRNGCAAPERKKLPPGTGPPGYFTKMEMRATPSIRAASVMAITMMGEEAPGLRPVASAAFAPMRPMPRPGADGDEAEAHVAGQFGQGGHCGRINHVIGMVYVFC